MNKNQNNNVSRYHNMHELLNDNDSNEIIIHEEHRKETVESEESSSKEVEDKIKNKNEIIEINQKALSIMNHNTIVEIEKMNKEK